VDLRQLDYFLRVARRRSITAAASDLNITQPTLTKSIRLLEQELGVALFERLPRGVELTEFGRSLVRHAEAIRVQVQDAVEELDGLRGGDAGVVTIGAGPAWLRRHLPQAVAQALLKRPKLRARIQGGFDEALLRALRSGELDFVVAELPSPEGAGDMLTTNVTSDSFGVLCTADHPLAAEKGLAPERLLDFPWVMPPRASRAMRRLEALFTARGISPPVAAVESDSLAFVLAMLRQSNALTYTVATTLQYSEGAGLVMLDVPDLAARRAAGVITRRGAWISPAAQAIIAELRAICEADPHN